MNLFKGLFTDSLPRMIAEELERSRLELFKTRLHLEAEQAAESKLLRRIARLEKEQRELNKDGSAP